MLRIQIYTRKDIEYLLNLRLEHDNEPQTTGGTKEEHIAKCQDN